MLYACNLRNGFGILNELTLCKSREKPVFGGRGGSARWVRVLLDFCRFCWQALALAGWLYATVMPQFGTFPEEISILL